jgi:hypothetical protein
MTAYNANVNTTMRMVPPGRHVYIARDPSASAGDELGIQAHDRINADFNVDNPDTPPRASQKLIAASPSTPEARNLHREVQALIEQAAVQQAESSASRISQ